MTVLIIIASWLLVVSVVIGLCVAARRGDLQHERSASAATWGQEPESIVISAHTSARHGSHAERDRQLVGAGGATG
jgi:hypothetical protein